MYSADGWCLTGDAGAFVDPFYSPGNDFIAINNGFICNMLLKQLQGEDIKADVVSFENQFRIIFLSFLPTYQDQYPIMGHAKVMTIKILWDFVIYWYSVGVLFFADKLTDLSFMATAKIHLLDFYQLNLKMQELFRTWSNKEDSTMSLSDTFLDYTKVKFLHQANENLLLKLSDEQLLTQLTTNLSEVRRLANEIIREAGISDSGINTSPIDEDLLNSTYFENVFAVFK
jgi:hypothetical protein